MHDDSRKVELPRRRKQEKPIPSVYPVLDTDLARDNVENDIPAARTWRTCEDSGLLPHSWEVKRMASISVSLDRNADRHDVKLLKRELDTLPGVTSVSVSSGGQLAVDYDATGVRQADILEKIQALGYHVRQEHA